MVQDKDAGSLINKVADVMATIHHRMREHGWRINYKKGKTEVLLRLAGAQATSWRRQLHLEEMNQLQVQAQQVVRITARYKFEPEFVRMPEPSCDLLLTLLSAAIIGGRAG